MFNETLCSLIYSKTAGFSAAADATRVSVIIGVFKVALFIFLFGCVNILFSNKLPVIQY